MLATFLRHPPPRISQDPAFVASQGISLTTSIRGKWTFPASAICCVPRCSASRTPPRTRRCRSSPRQQHEQLNGTARGTEQQHLRHAAEPPVNDHDPPRQCRRQRPGDSAVSGSRWGLFVAGCAAHQLINSYQFGPMEP